MKIENITSTFGNLDNFLCIDTDCAIDQNVEKNNNLKIEISKTEIRWPQ